MSGNANSGLEAKASNRDLDADDWDAEHGNKRPTGKSTPIELSQLGAPYGEPSRGEKTVTTVKKKEIKVKTNLSSSQNLHDN